MSRFSGGTVRFPRLFVSHDKQNNPFYGDPLALVVYETLLGFANWRDAEHPTRQGFMLKRGQCVFDQQEIADLWGLSRAAVRRRLEKLKTMRKIGLQTGPLGSVATILDYDEITESIEETGQPTGQQAANKRPTPGHIRSREAGKQKRKAPAAGFVSLPMKDALKLQENS